MEVIGEKITRPPTQPSPFGTLYSVNGKLFGLLFSNTSTEDFSHLMLQEVNINYGSMKRIWEADENTWWGFLPSTRFFAGTTGFFCVEENNVYQLPLENGVEQVMLGSITDISGIVYLDEDDNRLFAMVDSGWQVKTVREYDPVKGEFSKVYELSNPIQKANIGSDRETQIMILP